MVHSIVCQEKSIHIKKDNKHNNALVRIKLLFFFINYKCMRLYKKKTFEDRRFPIPRNHIYVIL